MVQIIQEDELISGLAVQVGAAQQALESLIVRFQLVKDGEP